MDRVGDYKLIYGTVGVTTVIPDDPFKCADCCPLKRPPLPNPGGKSNICANRIRESRDEAENDATPKAAYVCTKTKPCMFNVRTDVNESVNLAELPEHQDTRKHIESRILYHFGRQYNRDIDHTNVTTEEYCAIVKQALWAEPYGYARPPPAPFVPPAPSPIAPALASEISGNWAKGNEWFAMSVQNNDSVHVQSTNCTGCCFKVLQGSAREVGAGVAELFLSGRKSQCGNYPDAMRGNLSSLHGSTPMIQWEGQQEDGSWRPTWTPWQKVP